MSLAVTSDRSNRHEYAESKQREEQQQIYADYLC